MANERHLKTSKIKIPLKQKRLRTACQNGDIREVEAVLAAEESAWKLTVQSLCGTWLLRCLGVEENWQAPARLDYVYDDDNKNLPIHYIASGASPSRLVRMLYVKSSASRTSDRARLLAWLVARNHAVDLNATNGSLQTALHCALASNSTAVLETLLQWTAPKLYARGPELPALSIAPLQVATRDASGNSPLDVALLNQQWGPARLLVAEGALGRCPDLQTARQELDAALPPGALGGLKSHASGGGGGSGGGLLGLLADLPMRLGTQVVDLVLGGSAGSSDVEAFKRELAAVGSGAHRGGTGEEAEDEAAAAACALSNHEELMSHRQLSIDHVAYVLDVDACTSTALLQQHSWSETAAIDAYFGAPAALNRPPAHGGTSADAGSAAISADETSVVTAAAGAGLSGAVGSETRRCIVCFEDVAAAAGSVGLACGHVTCDDCWRRYLLVRLEEGDVDGLCCPSPGCRQQLPPISAAALLPVAQWERCQRLQAQRYVDLNPRIKWCPRPGCGRAVALTAGAESASGAEAAGAAGRALDVACSCGTAFCLTCLQPPHEPAPCDQIAAWGAMMSRLRQEEASRSEAWKAAHTRRCPGCGAAVERNGGCNHMTCSVCRQQWCWVCGRDWSLHFSGAYLRCDQPPPEEAGPGMPPFGSSGGASEGPIGFLAGLVGKVQDVATHMRLDHFVRHYRANECDAAHLHATAAWMAALLRAGYALTDAEPPAAPRGLATAIQEGVGQPRGSDGTVGGGTGSNGPSTSTPDPSAPAHKNAAGRSGCCARPSSTDDSSSHDNADHESPAARPYEYLYRLAREVEAGRAVLRSSYVLGYHLGWGERRRCFEAVQARLSGAVELLSLPLALLPEAHEVVWALAGRSAEQLGNLALPRLPLQLLSPELVRRQFYYAVAVHQRAGPLRELMAETRAVRLSLLRGARRGVFSGPSS